MISDHTTVHRRALATRSLRLALQLEGDAKRDALKEHFAEFTPSVFARGSCAIHAS